MVTIEYVTSMHTVSHFSATKLAWKTALVPAKHIFNYSAWVPAGADGIKSICCCSGLFVCLFVCSSQRASPVIIPVLKLNLLVESGIDCLMMMMMMMMNRIVNECHNSNQSIDE